MKHPFIKLIPTKNGGMVDAPAPKPPSTSVVGALVGMMDRAYQSYRTRRETLEAAIAEQQEQLRQVNTAIASLEAAMTVAAIDPALTEEEAGKANAAADARLAMAGWTGDGPDTPLAAIERASWPFVPVDLNGPPAKGFRREGPADGE